MMMKMQEAARGEVTGILERLGAGDASAQSRLLPLVYDELRVIAGRLFKSQPRDHTLQPTALVHEAYLKMIGPDSAEPDRWKGRVHFLAVAAKAMRQILVNHARDQGALKRGGAAAHRVTLSDLSSRDQIHEIEVLAVHEELERLAEIAPRQAQVAELRFFAGLTIPEVAEALGVSKRTVELEWRLAKVWLLARLSDSPSASES